MVPRDFYLEHVLEYDLRIAQYYGEVAVHPCSGPHVFHATWERLPNVVYTEAGKMIKPMAAGSISVDEALVALGDRPVMLGIGEELPDGGEEAVIRRLFSLAATHSRLTFGFTSVGWKKRDEPAMLDLHRRINDFYQQVVEGSQNLQQSHANLK
jgi:hypothetical protein